MTTRDRRPPNSQRSCRAVEAAVHLTVPPYSYSHQMRRPTPVQHSAQLEYYAQQGGTPTRATSRRSGGYAQLRFDGLDAVPTDDAVEQAWLRLRNAPMPSTASGIIRAVDLFSGCGGLALGAQEASHSLEKGFELVLAADVDVSALTVLEKNFLGVAALQQDVAALLTGAVGDRLTSSEKALARACGPVDLLLGGPPCQGHSDFNNRTRRLDPKNELYFSMTRAAQVLEPHHILIENVPGALRDHGQVVQRTMEALQRMGYFVSYSIVDSFALGVPQRRRRLLVLASRSNDPDASRIEPDYGRGARSVSWAISDLVGNSTGSTFDELARSAPDTVRRIDYLFDNEIFDLPNSERPPCHRATQHTYNSIYGRLSWDLPSQTVTRGFYSMCMGRYVHPLERRTLTAHEAARLQYFPDFFDFSTVGNRSRLAKMIGNAVPTRMAHAACLELVR